MKHLEIQKPGLQFTVIYIDTVVFKAPQAKWKLNDCRSLFSSIQTEKKPIGLNLLVGSTLNLKHIKPLKPPHHKVNTVQWIQCVTK